MLEDDIANEDAQQKRHDLEVLLTIRWVFL